MTDKFQAESLITFAAELLVANGMQPDMAQDVAEVLVEGDLYGHDTHGLTQHWTPNNLLVDVLLMNEYQR